MCFQKDPVAELTAQAKLGSSFDGDALHGSRTGAAFAFTGAERRCLK